MGHTIVNLAKRVMNGIPIFNRRLVVEVAETFHVHYRNLRISLSQKDWEEFGKGMWSAWSRWEQRGKPECKEGTHIELCRKEVAGEPVTNELCSVNLNKNLYAMNEGRIFSDGAELDDETYIHVKIRDLRLELTKAEFRVFADCIKEASDAV